MVELYYCKVSSVNYGAGTANLTVEDQENQVITNVPFLAGTYDMPGIGDMVAAIFSRTGGKIGRGVVLGKIFSKGNRPRMSGPGVFFKEFTDGSYISYNPSDKSMTITADKINVKKIQAEEIIN